MQICTLTHAADVIAAVMENVGFAVTVTAGPAVVKTDQ